MLELENKNEKIVSIQRQLDELNGIERVLVLSDLHVPFHLEDEILKIVNKHKDTISRIVFAGDIMDCFSVSSFPKDYHIPLTQELDLTSSLLKKIDRLTPNIPKVLFFGNHEYRFRRFLANQEFDLATFFDTNILQIIKKGFSYRTIGNKKRTVSPLSDNFTVIDSWFYQYQDVIFAHPTNFSRIPMKTAHNTYLYFQNNGYKFNAVAIGHTHKLGNFHIGPSLVSELGCLCQTMDYANRGNINNTPQVNGYGLYTFQDGKCLVDQSGACFIGHEMRNELG